MPNRESAKHATTLSTTWTKRFTGWSKRVDDHVTGLNKSAEDWDETDAATRARNEKMARIGDGTRSEEHTSELQSLMRISYAVFCLTKKRIVNPEANQKSKRNT